ncbi:MAG: diaminopimelate decarboxylase [Nevskiaceae bacterium]|nr:MAG: diaminopimelate decarboxylase [Nevskiaceae bacterium]TBR72589.1 MAG: diaminopimelate decarboxylase [Nevskiaceae bacterium]
MVAPGLRRNAVGEAAIEGVSLADVAKRFGTPTYVYSRAALTANYTAFDTALVDVEHSVHFAVKANSNLAVLQVMAELGAGFDIVSGGELARVLRARGRPERIVFSGVGKTEVEIAQALVARIGCFNVESEAELHRLSRVAAARGDRAPVALRVNPDVDAKTHPYISTGLRDNKFGVAIEEAERLYRLAVTLPGLVVQGVACHIGSQLCELAPFIDALDRVLALVDRLAAAGIQLAHIDVGGGLGVRYDAETPPTPGEWAAAILPHLTGRNLAMHCEPGRAICANAGVLLTRVELLKPLAHRNFAIVDAAMNDLIRPSLYGAWHAIVPVVARSTAAQRWDIVGPVCESGDWLGKDRELALEEGDLLAILGAGAYGFAMSSNYNARPRAAEVMVDGTQAHPVRARETQEDLWRGEALLP